MMKYKPGELLIISGNKIKVYIGTYDDAVKSLKDKEGIVCRIMYNSEYKKVDKWDYLP